MLLYNITVGIDRDIETVWLDWIRKHYLPKIMATGLFVDSKMYKIVHDNDDNSVSFSIQLFVERIDILNKYLQQFAPAIIEEHRQKFVNRHVVFQTLLEEL
jgi:hypothetical protein